MNEKLQWIRLNKRGGDLKGCVLASKNNPDTEKHLDLDYVYQVTNGNRNNEEILDAVIMHIRGVAQIDKRVIIEVEGMTLGLPEVAEPKAA